MTSVLATNQRDLSVGQRTLRQILELAVEIASVDGLEGLTIGRLAEELKMSKSGLFAHFGSKLDLQLATIDAARDIFVAEVVKPALRKPRGVERLEALCRSWLSYSQRKVFRGGCFFAAAAMEFDSKPGLVRDRVATAMRDWKDTLTTAVLKAVEAGHLAKSTDAPQLAFEINAVMTAANMESQLFGEKVVYKRARVAIERLLSEHSSR